VSGVRLSRLFWIGAAAILIVAALVAVGSILRGDFGETEAQVLGTLLSLLVAGATAIAGLALIERGVAKEFAVAAIVGAALCFAVQAAGIWDGYANDALAQLWWSSIALLVTLLLLTTQRLLLREQRLALLFYGTATVASLATLLTSAAIIADEDGGGSGDRPLQAIAILWILTVLGYLLLPVLQRFTRAASATHTRVLGELDGVQLIATRGRADGVDVEAPAPGERLVLRRSG
jgi:hypothetical protein